MTTTILAVLGVNILVQIVKNKILPKFGATGVHVFIFVISFVYIVAKSMIAGNPAWAHAFEVGIQMLVGTIAVYEIVLKKILEHTSIPRVL